MTQVNKLRFRSPSSASRRRVAIDRGLDTDLFKSLSDPTRARLFACLLKCGRACSVSEVAECCDVDFSVVSRHLARLSSDGVLTSEKRGRTVWYEPRWDELSTKFRALADAIDEWRPSDAGGCCDEDCCG